MIPCRSQLAFTLLLLGAPLAGCYTTTPPVECEPRACPAIDCEFGFAVDEDGCTTCECAPPPMCEPVACLLYCEHGFATDPETGCETCTCDEPPVCDDVLCDLYCEWGFATDPATGCPICSCNPPPVCPPVACDLYCEYGYERDPETRCETCRCVPGPIGCRDDTECAAGEVCDFSSPMCAGPICSEDEPCPPAECWGLCVARPICEPVGCRLYCEHGFVVDPSTGCEICECREEPPPPPPPPTRLCLSDDDCDAGEICDTTVCYSPPCPPGMACPAVCYGACASHSVPGYEP